VLLLVAGVTIGLFFGEASCGIHSIEQGVAAIGRKNVAPSLRFAPPQPKYESAVRGWLITCARWLTPRSVRTLAYGR
jgi:hypothetical protein